MNLDITTIQFYRGSLKLVSIHPNYNYIKYTIHIMQFDMLLQVIITIILTCQKSYKGAIEVITYDKHIEIIKQPLIILGMHNTLNHTSI